MLVPLQPRLPKVCLELSALGPVIVALNLVGGGGGGLSGTNSGSAGSLSNEARSSPSSSRSENSPSASERDVCRHDVRRNVRLPHPHHVKSGPSGGQPEIWLTFSQQSTLGSVV